MNWIEAEEDKMETNTKTVIINSTNRFSGTTSDATYCIDWGEILGSGRYRLKWRYVDVVNYLVARYKFDGDLMNYATDTPVLDATSNDTAVYDTGIKRVGTSSYYFNNATYALGDWITLPNITLQSQMSFTIWIRPLVSSPFKRIFEYGNPRLASPDGNDSSLAFNGFTFATPSQNNTWNHIGITVDGTNINVYINGVFSVNGTLGAVLSGTTTFGYLGHSVSSGDGNYTGYMDDYRIYNRVLSSGEITAIYNTTT